MIGNILYLHVRMLSSFVKTYTVDLSRDQVFSV